VTGATRGLGLRTATHMAEMQAKTILAVRDTEKGAATKQGIIDELQKKGVTVDPGNIEVTLIENSTCYKHSQMLSCSTLLRTCSCSDISLIRFIRGVIRHTT
jgi:NAD(P)-dependent dehydrogenase (short-subunit alcohol dehydrogenase family)